MPRIQSLLGLPGDLANRLGLAVMKLPQRRTELHG